MTQRHADLRAHATVAAICAAALLLGFFLVPNALDLGSHLHSDGDRPRARQYLELALAERGVAREIVIPLAKIASAQGRPAAGLALLQQLQPANFKSEDVVLRRQLFREAGQTQAYVQELEKLRGLEPDVATLEALAQVYAEQQLPELQAEVLEAAVKLRPDDPARAQAAAHLHAAIGHKNRALQLLNGLWASRPDLFRPADFALLVALRVALDPTDSALQLVAQHFDRFGHTLARADLVQGFFAAERFTDVQTLVGPTLAQADPRSLELWARSMIVQGRAAQAALVLRSQLADGAVSGKVTTLLCEVALSSGDFAAALDIAQNAHFQGVDGRVLVWLASAAAQQPDRAAVRLILAQLPAGALASDPVNAAYLYTVAGLAAEARRWATVAGRADALTPTQQLWLAEIDLENKESGKAADVLADYCTKTGVSADTALRLASLWLMTGAVHRALAFFGPDPQAFSFRTNAARALLLAADNRPEEAWKLLDRPQFLNALLREDARQTVAQNGHREVMDWLYALTAVSQLDPQLGAFSLRSQLQLRPGQRPLQWLLASQYLALKQPTQLVDLLHELKTALLPAEKDRYRELLLAAYRSDAPVKDELIAAVTAFLSTEDFKGKHAESWVHLLLELGATRQAMPFVGRLAALRGGAWAIRQVELLKELGQTEEVLALWRAKGLDPNANRQERLDAASNLLVGGDRATALHIYQEIASDDPPQSDVVLRLLSIWGPRPAAEATKWLVQRARQASGEVQLAWLRHLLWIGAANEVLALLGDEPAAGEALAIALEALTTAKQFKPLATLTERRAPLLTDPAVVVRLAELCAAHGQKHAAEIAYVRVVQLNPQHGPALHYLAQTVRAAAEALKYWEMYFQLPPEDLKSASWRDRVAYGDLLLATTNRRAEGEQQLAVALRLLVDAAMPEAERAAQSGRLLARLNRSVEAIAWLEQAVKLRPCDDALRADLVALLIAVQNLERANALVDRPPSCAKGQK